MKAITPDEDRIALEQMLASTRVDLAAQKRKIMLHKEVFVSEPAVITQLEVQAIRTVAAIEQMETWIEELAKGRGPIATLQPTA